MVVREITVVYKCLMQPDKGVRAAWMPDPALRRITVVADPNVGLEVLKLIVLYNVITIAYEFQNDQVLAVRHDECFLLAQ